MALAASGKSRIMLAMSHCLAVPTPTSLLAKPETITCTKTTLNFSVKIIQKGTMMNKLLILIAALSAPVMAEQASCEQLGGTAELIMKHRQANKPMNQIMTIVKQHAPCTIRVGYSSIQGAVYTALKATSRKPLQSFAMISN